MKKSGKKSGTATRVKTPGYTIEPETYEGETAPTGRHVLSFRGNWLGTYNTKRETERARARHRAANKSQHELAQARLRDIDLGKCD
jgi:hypothetical protein